MSVERKADAPPQEEKQRLTPDKEHFTEDGYKWMRFEREKTFLPLIALENIETGTLVSTTVVDEARAASLRAWSGARHSRAPGTAWDIMSEMVEKDVDADQKLEQMFVTYGHASVADMAQLYAHIERVPMHFCMTTFNALSLNSGQEKSTRYQVEFQETPLHALENYVSGLSEKDMEVLSKAYQGMGRFAHKLFSDTKERIEEAFEKKYKPKNARERSSLVSRGLDTSRAFLLLGQHTGQYIGDTARNWARLIGDLKASPIPFYRSVSEDLERLFVPMEREETILSYKAEAPGLIRHTEENSAVNKNLKTLKGYLTRLGVPGKEFSINYDFRGEVDGRVDKVEKKFSSIDRAIAQYILTIWPGADDLGVLEWVQGQSDSFKKQLSQIVTQGHSHYEELPNLMATTETTLIMKGALAELRDFNRHRAWGRFIRLPLMHGMRMNIDTVQQILANGYVLPSYLTEVEEFKHLKREFSRDLTLYYDLLYAMLGAWYDKFGESIDYSFVINLLPLSHQVDLWMHGNPKQSLYMPHLRVRPGGQITYRIMAWEASKLIAESSPYLSSLEIRQRPEPASRKEFFDRG